MWASPKKDKSQCTEEKSNESQDGRHERDLRRVVEHGLEVSNLHCPKSYKTRNTFTNFKTYLLVELWLSQTLKVS